MSFSSSFSVCICLLLAACVVSAKAPVTDHKSKECPPGFILKGKMCEAIVVKEPQFVCPRGTSSVEGQCLTFLAPKIECPYGFTLSGNQCTQVQAAPVQYYCQEGELEGRTCKSLIPKPPVCPSGYQMDAGSCVRFAPVLKKCPTGYQQQGKQCHKQVSFPASPTCPSDMELSADGVKCYRFEQKQPFCPSGYSMDIAGGHQCVRHVNKVPAPCPNGFTVVGNKCETVEQHPIDILCPSDMQLDPSTESCVKEIAVPPKCPAGYVPSHVMPGECERFLPAKPVCPPETSPTSPGQCKRQIFTEKYPQCPAGFEMVGEKCKKVDEFPTRTVCRTGRQEGDQCVTSQSVSPQYACPEGFELTKTNKGPQCTRIAQYDCSTTTMKKECEMPEFVQHLTPNRKLKESYVPAKPAAVVMHQGKQPVCRQVPVQVPKTCTKQETAPVKYICPEGGVLVGKACQLQQYAPADTICSAGDMDVATGRCLKISIAPASWHCASGSDAGGMKCVQYETVPADYVCPVGTEPEAMNSHGQPKCVERKREMVFPNKVIKQQAKIVCPVGTLSGRVCLKPVHVAREWQCPQGAFPVTSISSSVYGNSQAVGDLKCAVAAELITPPPVEVAVPPKYICPDGALAPNKLCFTREGAPIEEYCPHGMAFTGGKCVAAVDMIQPAPIVKNVPASPSCPEGFSLQGSVCKTVQSVPVEKTCAPGYEPRYHHGKEACAKAHELQAVCPPGTVQGPEGCITRKHAPPQVTIVRTCTKGQPGCH